MSTAKAAEEIPGIGGQKLAVQQVGITLHRPEPVGRDGDSGTGFSVTPRKRMHEASEWWRLSPY